MSAPARPSIILPFGAASFGIASFSIMDVVMKSLSINLGAYNACLWRSVASTVMMGLIFLAQRRRWPAWSTMKLHLLRGSCSAGMMFLFFWGLVYVPLAEAIALSFIAPLITLYLAAVLLKEQIGARAIAATVIGFVGVIVIVLGRIGGHHGPNSGLGVLAILASAVLYAFNLILQRQQAQVAAPIEVALFNAAIVTFIFASGAFWFAHLPPTPQLPGILGAAILASLSLLALSWAYARAEAKVLIPVEYTAFIWAAIFGYLAFNEAVTARTLVGAAFIIIGCIFAALQERHHEPSAELGL
jgi:S-adenosylmethionine uptake transporter